MSKQKRNIELMRQAIAGDAPAALRVRADAVMVAAAGIKCKPGGHAYAPGANPYMTIGQEAGFCDE